MKDTFKEHLGNLTKYIESCGMDLYPYPKVMLNKASQAGDSMLHNTGHYNPQKQIIVLYVCDRHPKDILRSYAHELVHHHQHLCGQLTPDKMGEGGSDPKYAQNNDHLRKLEEEAYAKGNLLFRDYCDNKKYK